MQFIIRRPWDLPQRLITDEAVYRQRRQHRREFLAAMGGALGALAFAGCQQKPTSEELQAAAGVPVPTAPGGHSVYPAPRNPLYEYGRDETLADDAAAFTNFFEFTTAKSVYRHVARFQPLPWSVKVDGLCDRPTTFDMDDLYQTFAFEERAYRHRCVETWAMCIPWTGFPLADLIQHVGPQAKATFVRFETFNRPDEAPGIARDDSYPWPYTEGLTLAEATNELAFIATGVYAQPLPKQHGAPVRLVVPWKYGFKSIKSIVRITLTDERPATFWNTVGPREYDFEANVNPAVPHPRWSQRTEYMLGTRERFPTQIYNGYGEFVGSLYA
jgi:sulfoxide reductase catalytic subunit YedY